MADSIEDLPVIRLTDEVAATLKTFPALTSPYQTAMAVCEEVSDEALVAEVRRRGFYVIGKGFRDGRIASGRSD
ncbi:MAG TPA: hypothetical protein VIY48_19040 [Candidatus Paceibacterota bacterium]